MRRALGAGAGDGAGSRRRGRCRRAQHCGGWLKAATISFGQPLRPEVIERGFAEARRCDLVLALGSTLSVHPAAAIPLTALERGVPYVVINRGVTDHDELATLAPRRRRRGNPAARGGYSARERQDGVVAAEGEGVREQGFDGEVARGAGDVVEAERRVGRAQVDRRREEAAREREHRRGGFDGAGGAERVADHRLDARHRHARAPRMRLTASVSAASLCGVPVPCALT